MTGIIHFPKTGRISRRAAIAGVAGVALAGSVQLNAQTPEASPVSTPMARGGTYMADARDRLRDLLSLVPVTAMRGPDPAGITLDWVDWDAQFAALGIADPYAEESLISPTRSMMTSDPAFRFALMPELLDIVGFRPFDVHQVLAAGQPPDQLLLYRGGLDMTSLMAIWEANGYERRTGEHGDYWTIGEGGDIDVQHPVQRMFIASLNNVAILDDTTVAYALTAASLAPVMALAAGEGEAAAEDPELEQLIDAMPADAVNAVVFPGEMFNATSMVPENPGMETFTTVEELLAESAAAVGPMPEVQMSLCGVTAGASSPPPPAIESTPYPTANPDALAFMLFLTTSEEDAATAAEVAYWRLENMTSPTTGIVYSDVFVPAHPVEEAVEGNVVSVRFTGDYVVGGHWQQMIHSRDSWPFAWLPDQE